MEKTRKLRKLSLHGFIRIMKMLMKLKSRVNLLNMCQKNQKDQLQARVERNHKEKDQDQNQSQREENKANLNLLEKVNLVIMLMFMNQLFINKLNMKAARKKKLNEKGRKVQVHKYIRSICFFAL